MFILKENSHMSRKILSIVVAGLWGHWLWAAPVPPPPKMDDPVPPTTAKLLQHRKIQIELQMTAEQRIILIDRIADIEEEYDNKLKDLFQIPDFPLELFQKVLKDQHRALEKAYTDSAESLTAVQRWRLRQIDWHLRGAAALTDPLVQEKLQLTAAQKKKTEEIGEQICRDFKRYVERKEIEGASAKADLFAVRKDRLKAAERLLTDEQQAAWKRLLGPPPTAFNVDEMWLYIKELESDDEDP